MCNTLSSGIEDSIETLDKRNYRMGGKNRKIFVKNPPYETPDRSIGIGWDKN